MKTVTMLMLPHMGACLHSEEHRCDLSYIGKQANMARRKILDQLRNGSVPKDEWSRLQSPTSDDFRSVLEEKFQSLAIIKMI